MITITNKQFWEAYDAILVNSNYLGGKIEWEIHIDQELGLATLVATLTNDKRIEAPINYKPEYNYFEKKGEKNESTI